jgi:transcriptional regulator with XRE-family HTH domain
MERGLTQDKLAELVDLERRHYQRIETGKVPGLRVETVERIADVLNMEAADLMSANREPQRK